MGLVDRIANRLGYFKASDLKNIPSFLLDHARGQQYNMPDPSIYANQSSLYAKLSWIHTAIATPGAAAATTMLNVKKRNGEALDDVENHPFERLLDQPNPMQSRYEILEASYAWAKLNGNVYWWLNRRSREQEPSEIWILPPHMIEPLPDGKMYIEGYAFDPGTGQRPIILDTWQVMHLKAFNPLSMFVGLATTEAAAPAAAGDLAQQKQNLKFFDKEGGRLPGVFSFADMIMDDEWMRIVKEFKDKASKEQFMLLRGVGELGVKWTPMEMSRKEMQYLEARDFTKTELYDLFAPGLTSMLAPNANVASGRIGKETLMEFCVYPFHQQLAMKINNDIMPCYGDNMIAEFEDVRERDRAMELKEQEAAWKVMTIDEVRERFWEMEPIDPDAKTVDGSKVNTDPSPFMQMNPELPPGERTRDNSQQDGIEDEDEEVAAKAVQVVPTRAQLVRDELRQWQRFVTKRIKAGKSLENARDFDVEHVPASLYGAIDGALEAAKTTADVAAVFDNALLWQGYP